MCRCNGAVHVLSPMWHSVKWSVSCEQNCRLLQIRNQIQPSTNDREISECLEQGRHKESLHGCVKCRHQAKNIVLSRCLRTSPEM